MAKSFLTSLQLNGNSILNGKVDARWAATPSGTTNPDGTGTAVAGQISSYAGNLYVYTGLSWAQLSTASGTVSSVSGTSGSVTVVNGSSTPVISLTAAYGDSVNPYGSKTANYVLAAPNGSNGVPSFRALVGADIPTLNQDTTGIAGRVANSLTFSTGLNATFAGYNGSAATTLSVVSGTTSTAGIVQLSDSTSTTSSTLAATATAAKAAYDRGSLGVTDAATAQTTANAALPKAGGTMSGAIAMGGSKITGLGTPTADGDAVTKAYVDTAASGINVHEAVKYATTDALGTTNNLVAGTVSTTYSNGTSGLGATLTISVTGGVWTAITIDGQTLTVTDRVLIKNQSATLQNGIYTVTQVGTLGSTTSFIFTRAVDNDQSPEIDAGDLTYVIAGSTNAGDGYVQTVANITVGTTGVVWTQFSGAGAIPYASTSVAGIASFDSTQFTVDGVGKATVNNLSGALITSSTVAGQYGGTGVNNSGKTITLGGNLVTSGAFATTLTVTGTTNVTLPTTGTLVNTAVTTLSSLASVGTITTGVWNGTAVGVLYGGTGATTAAAARTNLGATTKVTAAGSGSGTSIAVAHGLGTAVIAQLLDSTGAVVEVDVVTTATASGTTTFTFSSTQTLSNFTYVIIG